MRFSYISRKIEFQDPRRGPEVALDLLFCRISGDGKRLGLSESAIDVACWAPVGVIPRSAHINMNLYCRGGGMEGEMSAPVALNRGLADS